jgi:hypothetical protein
MRFFCSSEAIFDGGSEWKLTLEWEMDVRLMKWSLEVLNLLLAMTDNMARDG